MVRRDIEGMIAVRCALEFAAADNLYAVLPLQTPDAALTNIETQRVQFRDYTRPAALAESWHISMRWPDVR